MPDRCPWCLANSRMIAYHDKEWGVPVHNDRKLFEFMVLDAFQAGLSWSTILDKRRNFKLAFDNFDPRKIARYDKRKIESLLKDAGIIRNRQKIEATIRNARALGTGSSRSGASGTQRGNTSHPGIAGSPARSTLSAGGRTCATVPLRVPWNAGPMWASGA